MIILRKKKGLIDNGFTLVELIVVIIILGIISAISVPIFQNTIDRAKQKECSLLLKKYAKAAKLYFLEKEKVPNHVNELNEFVSVIGDDGNLVQRSSGDNWISPSGRYHMNIATRNAWLGHGIVNFSCQPKPGWNGYPSRALFCSLDNIVLVKDFKGRRNNQIPGDGGPECPTNFDEYPNLHNRDKWGF